MIRYALKCDQDHRFESWFASASAYDTLRKAGHVSCVECGSVEVEKTLMAPAVTATKAPKNTPAAPPAKGSADAPARAATEGALSTPREAKLAALRRKVEANSDYVGNNFVSEARAMHLGDAPERPIWGEARIDEAKALVDDGVPVLPLPFIPRSKTN
ncbi:DUF1178 family protein [Pararhodobacter oceanensis]|uniref:DUF1178 family protein n=1 Tax=Pararhodobacter oceanensis TaxID=2172121 RepID=UPI003A8EED2D